MVRSLEKRKPIAIIGPTASGKSGLALALAERIKGEIVSCDSVQVYKRFNIGSAKPNLEERHRVPHHLIDLVSWNETFDAARYRELALQSIKEISERGHVPIIAGGTGLYFRALCGEKFHDLPSDVELRKQLDTLSNEALMKKLQELDLVRAKKLHPNDRFRLMRACEISMLTGQSLASLSEGEDIAAIQPFTVLCNPPREDLLEIIQKRSVKMLQDGLVDEVESLLKQGCPDSAKPMQSIGYRQVCEYLKGDISENQLLEKIVIATRQYARKQLMWFRNVRIDMELNNPYDVESCVERILKRS